MDILKDKQSVNNAFYVMSIIGKSLVILILIIAIFFGGTIIFINFYDPVDINDIYQTETIGLQDISRRIMTTGSIEAMSYEYVSINTSQRVSEIHVKVGDHVEIGDLLISYDIEREMADLQRRLDSTRLNEQSATLTLQSIELPAEGNVLLQYNADVTSAQHNVDQAQNEMRNVDRRIEQQQNRINQAQRTVDRNLILFNSGGISRIEYDLSVTALSNARLTLDELIQSRQAAVSTQETRQIQLEEAQQRLFNAQDRLRDEATVLQFRQQELAIQQISRQIEQIQSDLEAMSEESVSSESGYVTAIHVREGEMAIRGVVLVEIAVTSEIIAVADISEFDAPRLQIGQDATVTARGLPDTVYTAKIYRISRGAVRRDMAAAEEVIVPVEFLLYDEDDYLKVGYSVDIAIYTDIRERVMAVPIHSVVVDGDQKFLYIVRDDDLVRTPIITGFQGDRSYEIASGVGLGTRYVVAPLTVTGRPFNWYQRALRWLYSNLSWVMDHTASSY